MNTLHLCIIDSAAGAPAEGVHVTLERHGPGERRHVITDGTTAADGCIAGAAPTGIGLEPGRYSATCRVAEYFGGREVVPLFPEIHLMFDVPETSAPVRIRVQISPQSHNVVCDP